METPNENIMLAEMLQDGYCIRPYPITPDGKWDETSHLGLAVACNDMFAWGMADYEPIPYAAIKEVYAAFKAGNLRLWIAQKRNMQPQKPLVEMMKEAGHWTPEWEMLPPNPYDDL